MATRQGQRNIDLSDVQSMQELQDKILRFGLILDSCLDVARKVNIYISHQQPQEQTCLKHSATRIVTEHVLELDAHRRTIKAMMKSSKEIREHVGLHQCEKRSSLILLQLASLLAFRNDNHLLSICDSTKSNIELVYDVATRIQHENSEAARIVQRAERHRLAMKALSSATVIFLPSTLVAVSLRCRSEPNLPLSELALIFGRLYSALISFL